ncbi:MAG: SCO family protein [Pseudomonadota bacterium]
MSEQSLPRTLIIGLASLVVVGVTAIVWLLVNRPASEGTQSKTAAMQSLIGGPFSLVDHNGQPVTETTYHGRKTLIYFGFTYCPDVCPMSLTIMTEALNRLGDGAQDVVPLFITVDPERDTPDILRDYVTAFHPALVGLTGELEAVQDAAKAYRVYFAKIPDPDVPGAYTMDHSSLYFLMDEEGKYLAHFNHATTPSAMADQLRAYL